MKVFVWAGGYDREESPMGAEPSLERAKVAVEDHAARTFPSMKGPVQWSHDPGARVWIGYGMYGGYAYAIYDFEIDPLGDEGAF